MHKEIGQQLLALADHPRDVQWVTYPETGYAVPMELFRRFDTIEPGHIDEPAEEAPKRRRRPRREEASTDNTTSEEE